MKVLARHYLCFAGQLCGVSTDGTASTAIVLRVCVDVIGSSEAGQRFACIHSMPLPPHWLHFRWHCALIEMKVRRAAYAWAKKILPAMDALFCRCLSTRV